MKASFLFADLPAATPKEVHALFDLWKGLRAAHSQTREALPARRLFTADLLERWLDHLAIAAYQEDEHDVLVLRAGGAITKLLGVDLNLRRFSQALPMLSQAAAVAPYRAALRVRRPTFSILTLPGFPRVARLILPMDTGPGVEFLVGVYSIDDERAFPPQQRALRYAANAAAHFVILDVDGVRESPAGLPRWTPQPLLTAQTGFPSRRAHKTEPLSTATPKSPPEREVEARPDATDPDAPDAPMVQTPLPPAPTSPPSPAAIGPHGPLELRPENMTRPDALRAETVAFAADAKETETIGAEAPAPRRELSQPIERSLGELRRVLGGVAKTPGWRFAKRPRRRKAE